MHLWMHWRRHNLSQVFFQTEQTLSLTWGYFLQVLSTPKMRSCCCVSCLAETALNFYVPSLCQRLVLNDINGTTSRFLDEVDLLCFSCGGVCVNDINTLSCTVCALIKDPSQICGKRLHFCLCLWLMLNDIEVQSSCVLTLIPTLFGWHLHGSMEFHTIEIDCPLDFCSFISERRGNLFLASWAEYHTFTLT